MKRENGYNLTHHFPFGERFDETLMKGYSISCQCIRLSNHQFIGISPLNKSIEETAAPSLPVDITADTIAGFWETKSHSSLGRFLHAPLTLMLKTP